MQNDLKPKIQISNSSIMGFLDTSLTMGFGILKISKSAKRKERPFIETGHKRQAFLILVRTPFFVVKTNSILKTHRFQPKKYIVMVYRKFLIIILFL